MTTDSMTTDATRSPHDLVDLVRQVLIEGASAGLDVAGNLLLPGAWPFLSRALAPVLDRLKARLGGKDPTASREAAARAADEFARDEHLQAMLRSNLLLALEPVMQGQRAMDDKLQYLVAVANDDTERGKQILAGVTTTNETLVEMSSSIQAQLDELRELVVARVTNVEATRSFARSDEHPVEATEHRDAELTRDDIIGLVAEEQSQALQLLRQGDADQAAALLRRTRQLLDRALDDAPTDTTMKILYGYFAKDTAQVYQQLGQSERVDRYLGLARRAFELITAETEFGTLTANDAASAWNGLGNVHALTGDVDAAITYERRALDLVPDYAEAWHDLFVDYLMKANAGSVDLPAMEHALEQLRQSAPGHPGLESTYLDQLAAELDTWRATKG